MNDNIWFILLICYGATFSLQQLVLINALYMHICKNWQQKIILEITHHWFIGIEVAKGIPGYIVVIPGAYNSAAWEWPNTTLENIKKVCCMFDIWNKVVRIRSISLAAWPSCQLLPGSEQWYYQLSKFKCSFFSFKWALEIVGLSIYVLNALYEKHGKYNDVHIVIKNMYFEKKLLFFF